YPNGFNPFTSGCPAGVWCAHAAADNPDLSLLFPGFQGALHVGRDGNLRPINTSVYKRLTIRMYIDQVPSGSPGWQVVWPKTDVTGSADSSLFGQSAFLPLLAGWNIYSVDLSTAFAPAGAGHLTWTGNLTGLRLNIGLHNMTGHTVEIDWAR